MSTQSNNCIIFFVRAPEAGKVKTRLAAEIGEDAAIGLYNCFVEDLLTTIENVDGGLRLLFQPFDAGTQLRSWLGDRHTYCPQKGDDLGEKMKNAFKDAFKEGFCKVVLIGSDIPDLPADFLPRAFTGLDSSDAVIGPSSDGGYYLIGFTRDSFAAEVFDGITWSTSAVFKQTLAKLKSCGLRVCQLPLWYDVDTRADLDDLIARTGDGPFNSSRTFALLRRSESQAPES